MTCIECGQDKPKYARGLCQGCYNSQWQAAHPGYMTEKHQVAAAKKHRLAVGFHRMLLQQPCGLCGATEGPKGVDHDHTTQLLRGVLCRPCNIAVASIDRHGLAWAQKAVAWVGFKGELNA